MAAYREAQKLEPRNAEAALGIARSYRTGKQWARAVEAYERLAVQHRRLDGQAQLGIAWCYYRSGDSYKAGFYTGLAARAGADVSALRSALGKPVWAADELDELLDQLRSKHAGEQSRAVKRLAGLGRSGVPHLVSALQRRTTAIGVRETIVEALGQLGSAAREALPVLDRLIEAGPLRGGDARESERETRLVGAMREAVAKIRSVARRPVRISASPRVVPDPALVLLPNRPVRGAELGREREDHRVARSGRRPRCEACHRGCVRQRSRTRVRGS